MKNASFTNRSLQTNNLKFNFAKAVALCIALFAGLLQAHAVTRYVSVSGSDLPGNGTLSNPYRHIQYAISQSVHLDIIKVKPGLYCENVDFMGKNLKIESTDGADQTIIQGDGTQSVVLLDNVSGNATLKGFSIRGGWGTVRDMGAPGTYSAGGGVLVYHCNYLNGAVGNKSILLSELKVYDNSAFNGGGIFVYATKNANIERCQVYRNNATGHGGGIGYVQHTPTLTCKISNTLICHNNASINGGGLLIDYGTRLTMHFMTIAENSAPIGSTMRRSNGGGVFATNCILTPASNNDLWWAGGTNFNSTLTNCCIPFYAGTTNMAAPVNCITSLPLFKPHFDRFQLDDASPCINAGVLINGYNNATDLTAKWPRLIGAPGQYDIGAYEMPFCGAYPRPAGEEETQTASEETEERSAETQPTPATTDFQIFPNPATQTIEITFTAGEGAEQSVQIFDLSGKQMKTLSANDAEQTTLDISDLPQGIYTVKVGDGPAQKLVRM